MREMEHDFTAQLGTAAYPAFSEKLHVKKAIKLSPTIPIALCCDFNVDPCVFEICQIKNGYLLVIDEVCLSPASIPEMVNEFRNRYPAHIAGINIYGDSNGLTRSVQTQKSEYDLMKLHFRGYPGAITIKVPRNPPRPKDRINALNNKLKGYEDRPMMFISSQCPELIADLTEVVLNKSGNDVLKKYSDDGTGYNNRTHASDAVGYLAYREWPLNTEAIKEKLRKNKPRKPIKYGKLAGSIE